MMPVGQPQVAVITQQQQQQQPAAAADGYARM